MSGDPINGKNCRGICTMDVPSFVVSLIEDSFVQRVVLIGCPETSATNYHSVLRKNPRRAHISEEGGLL